MRRDGFTLIELLVVVSIITVLIAILLPSMSRAVEVTHRAVCASNLHQIGSGMISYATDHFGQIPLGYIDNNMGSNYHMIWGHTTPHRFMMMGVLYGGGMITDGKVFYCPSQTFEQFMYDTPRNRWDEPYTDGVNKPTRSGYSVRPLYNGQKWSWNSHPNPIAPTNMARIQTLTNAVIAADNIAVDFAVDATHAGGEGINRLRNDGSVNWVDREVFDEFLTPGLSSTFQDQLWTALDR